MHKATLFEGTITFCIQPDGPILIKAGESSGVDPTLPDMEFVRTRRIGSGGGEAQGDRTIYLPGSSLKGVIRAQCERICRSLDREGRDPDQDNPPLADNPQGKGKQYRGRDDMEYSSGAYLNEKSEKIKGKPDRTALIYRQSSFVSQMFGHTSLAGRVRFADAYPSPCPDATAKDATASTETAGSAETTRKPDHPSTQGEIITEERNGVAIDRIYGSVAHGPFNYETVVAGTFQTRITFKNITLAQLALLGLALNDLGKGRIGIGSGKSRGLGRVKVLLDNLELFYPTCELDDSGNLHLLTGQQIATASQFVGIGALYQHAQDCGTYKFPAAADDTADMPQGLVYTNDELMGVRLTASGKEQVEAVWRKCMPLWEKVIGL